MKTSLAKLLAPYVLALLSLGVSGWVAYNKADKQTSVDMAKMQQQQADDRASTKDRLDNMQKQLDQLMVWALGHK